MHIKIQVIEKDEKFWLYTASGVGQPNPAGDRLQRTKPLPIDSWVYENEEDAGEAAGLLQEYLDDYERKKDKRIRKSKRLSDIEDKYREHIRLYGRDDTNRKT